MASAVDLCAWIENNNTCRKPRLRQSGCRGDRLCEERYWVGDGRRSCPTDDLVFGCSRHEGYLDYRPLHLLQHDGAWDPPWIGPRECWLHLTAEDHEPGHVPPWLRSGYNEKVLEKAALILGLVGAPAILESADTSIARISLVMNEGGCPEGYLVEE